MRTRELIIGVIGFVMFSLQVVIWAYGQDSTGSSSGRPVALPTDGVKATESRRLEYDAQRLRKKEIELKVDSSAIEQSAKALKKDVESAKQRYQTQMRTAIQLQYTGCPNHEPFGQCSHVAQKQEYVRRKAILKSQAELQYDVAKRGLERRFNELKQRLDRFNLDRRRYEDDKRQLDSQMATVRAR